MAELREKPRVVVIGLASCFGCQIQITNVEKHLMDVVGQIDLRYWQLTSDGHLPEEFDVAVIEGAVTTEESATTVKRVRDIARKVIALGACATTAGIPGMASPFVRQAVEQVYGVNPPEACGIMRAPVPVSEIISVDYEVRCCPIDTLDFIDILQQALYGSNREQKTSTMCGECKRNDSECFYKKGKICLGLVTRSGCKARCVNLNRPCNGCRGLSPSANIQTACEVAELSGLSSEDFLKALEMFNQNNPQYREFCGNIPETGAISAGKQEEA